MKKYCPVPGQLPRDFVLELKYTFKGENMENYFGITGAWVGPESQKGSWSNQTPVCRVKEQLGILISALVMPAALTLPHSHHDTLQDSPGQAPCASLLQSPRHPQLG